MNATISPARAVGLVARREFSTQIRKKSFLISNIIILIAIIGGIIVYSAFSGGDDGHDATVAIVGDQTLAQPLESTGEAMSMTIDVREIPDEQTARTAVSDGDVDAALLPAANGSVTAITESELGSDLHTIISAAVSSAAQERALAAQDVDVAAVDQAVSAATVHVDALNPPDPEKGQRIAMSIAAVVLLYMQILTFGMFVAMGVVEEKSSRVVELLLSTVRPLHLLWGKIFGIGAVGLIQLTAYGVAGVAAGLATGVLTVTGTAVATLFATLGWFVLGYALFAVLYAAAGSMVSRQEDVNSTAMPLMILIVAMFIVAFSTVDNPDSTAGTVLSWIPPFSAILMPLRIAAGVAGPGQIVGTIAIMLVAIAALSVVAAKIYQRSILRIGKVVSWKEALGR
ncbi:ABC transporter permease [Tomitella fengzijianii]|uniref:ABC transporter permease n=1 Tax=Tomitella fengzijianii TaxID=2597660 RepID=A0A516X0V5_9ACTN|nr:ABC transporter permease [Tomitella fengzijianii]QDQ96726.1 ABC transporter permease [Tomitella fengzijianii]